ncbi:MAG: LamG-like jellyroll fold domain-containing protein [Desulfobacterales bacterium]
MICLLSKKLHTARKGAVLLILIACMTLISVLGAAVLSITATSARNDLVSASFIRAGYLAESGMRYAALKNLPENTYVTVWEQDGVFHMTEESIPPVQKIRSSGFRISANDCGMDVTGVVGEGSSYESQRKIFGKNRKGLPCWHFDEFFWNAAVILDSCGSSQGEITGSSWARGCEGKGGGTLVFGGLDFVHTEFRPFCEIGNQSSFTVSFLAKPAGSTQGTVLGVRDGTSAFSVGISGSNWAWAFGDRSRSAVPVSFDKWQQVTVVYDAFSGAMTMQVDDCLGSGYTDIYDYGTANGSAAMPEMTKYLFIGAENFSGTPVSRFTGAVDEIRIYSTAMEPDLLKPVCPESGAVAWYPFNGSAVDESSTAPQFDGTVTGAAPAPDRFKCPDMAYAFDGSASIDGDIDPAVNPMISAYPFSVSAWIRSDSADAAEKVIFSLSDQNSDEVQFGIYLNENSQLCLRAKESDAVLHSECTAGTLDAGSWHFVTGTFASADADTKLYLTLYADGVQAVPPALSPVYVTCNPNTVTRWSAGRWGNLNPSGHFKGAIDDISVWPRELTHAEVSRMYQEKPE